MEISEEFPLEYTLYNAVVKNHGYCIIVYAFKEFF